MRPADAQSVEVAIIGMESNVLTGRNPQAWWASLTEYYNTDVSRSIVEDVLQQLFDMIRK